MAALRIHQHGVDDVRIAFPFPPLAFRAAGQIRRVAALQHHALDRFGVLAGAGTCRIGARRLQRVPAVEGNCWRQVDAGIVELCDESFELCAALGEGQFAKIIVSVAEQIVGAQMDRKILHQLRRDDLAVQTLLKNVEGLHPAVAQHQQLTVDRARQMQRRQQVRKAFGDVLAGARIEPRDHFAMLVTAAHRLNTDAVPFPFGDEIGGVEIGKIGVLDGMRQHHRPERRRIEIDRLVGAALQPREQIEVGRRKAWPHQFDIVGILVAERGRRGLGETRGNADPHRAGDEF